MTPGLIAPIPDDLPKSQESLGTTRLMYMECKAGGLTGPARIGRVSFSKTWKSIYYGGKHFQRIRGYKCNYVDRETGEEYWISGPKKDGSDRLYAERIAIEIDDEVREEYWCEVRINPNVNWR